MRPGSPRHRLLERRPAPARAGALLGADVVEHAVAQDDVGVVPGGDARLEQLAEPLELGEVDAGVVYVTDVRAAGSKVKGIEIPADVNASTTYPIAAMTKSHNGTAAGAFVNYVLSSAGIAVLTADGFEQP